MNKLIIHIGYHKTGTTFLNRKFFTNHPQIHHMGKPYAEDDPIREIVERVIGLKKYDVDLCRSIYEKNIVSIQQRKIISISDGQIVKQNHVKNFYEIPKRLIDIFGDISVIVVIRKQYDYIKSLYVQHIGVNNEKKSFDEWFDQNWDSGGMLKSRVNYLDRIKPYIEILGTNNVGIFIYEELQKNPESFIKNICDFIDCNYPNSFKKDNKRKLNKRMTTLHKFFNTNSFFRFILFFAKKVIPLRYHNLINNFIFSKFRRYDPQLSKDRAMVVKDYSRISNRSFVDELGIELSKYNYDL